MKIYNQLTFATGPLNRKKRTGIFNDFIGEHQINSEHKFSVRNYGFPSIFLGPSGRHEKFIYLLESPERLDIPGKISWIDQRKVGEGEFHFETERIERSYVCMDEDFGIGGQRENPKSAERCSAFERIVRGLEGENLRVVKLETKEDWEQNDSYTASRSDVFVRGVFKGSAEEIIRAVNILHSNEVLPVAIGCDEIKLY